VEEQETDRATGEIPEGVGPEVFREHLRHAARQGTSGQARIQLGDDTVVLGDIESVEEEPGGHRSRVRLRNGLIIGGLTGAAIVAALGTIRYIRRHSA
jgi:hypothetical protein